MVKSAICCCKIALHLPVWMSQYLYAYWSYLCIHDTSLDCLQSYLSHVACMYGNNMNSKCYIFCSNQDEAAKLLLDAGADVNCKNAVGIFPLTLCTALGNYRVLRLLANHPKVNLHNQVIHLHGEKTKFGSALCHTLCSKWCRNEWLQYTGILTCIICVKEVVEVTV